MKTKRKTTSPRRKRSSPRKTTVKASARKKARRASPAKVASNTRSFKGKAAQKVRRTTKAKVSKRTASRRVAPTSRPESALPLLMRQHREALAMFARMKKMGEGEAMDKRELFAKLAHALTIHTTIEERHFYPAARTARTEVLVTESLLEHLAVKRQVAELLSLPHADRSFDARIKALQEQVEHHTKVEEEGRLFPRVKRLLDVRQLEALGAQMRGTVRELEQLAGAVEDQPLGQVKVVPAVSIGRRWQ